MGAAAILTILRNGETVKACPIEGEVDLGRAEGCVIRLEDRAISRHHAVFRPVDGGIQIEKRSEFAPLQINGAEKTSAILKEGDVVSIGPYLMRLSIQANAAYEPALQAAPALAIPDPSVSQTQGDSAVTPLAAALDEVPSADLLAPGDPASSEGAGADLALSPIPNPAEQPAEAAALPAFESPAEPVAELTSAPNLAIVEQPPEEATAYMAPVDGQDDGETKISSADKFRVRLLFNDGAANVTDFELVQDEITIGRGKNCDIILNDKKASRKNAIIRRDGLRFLIRDLGSANGTYVNEEKIHEKELSGNDRVRIGDVEFQFKVTSSDYEDKEKDFLSVHAQPPEGHEDAPQSFDFALPDANGAMPVAAAADAGALADLNAGYAVPAAAPVPGAFPGAPGEPMSGAIPGIIGIPGGLPGGIPGVGGAGKNASLMEKFRALPKSRQYIWIVIVIGLGYFLLFDEDEQPAKKVVAKKPGITASSGVKAGPATFESLTPEQKKFVESQHAMAFDYYKNKEYDKSLFEIAKIFALVQDYKDSREIERYAKEGKRKMEALEEEKKRREEEARLKAKIAQLEDETRSRMAKKHYEQARELFAQILALDPENPQVEKWRKEIEVYEEAQRIAEEKRIIQKDLNNQAWAVYREGLELKRKGRYHSAIAVFDKVDEMGATDKKLLALAKSMIAKSRYAIKALRDPELAQGREAENAREFAKAYQFYLKATKIDPPHPEGYAGIKRVRGVLHDRAKALYTEAVLAESYSDFTMAKKKFQEILEVAPRDDIYFERAERKLARYFRKDKEEHFP